MKRLALLLILFLAACAPQTQAPAGPITLTVMTHDSFEISSDLIAQFERENNANVVFLKSGDAGAALNKAILSKEAPLADVFYGVDNTFLSRALEADIFEPYASPQLEHIPDNFQLDSTFRALPVDYGDVCINYDKAYFAEHSLPLPQSLEDLTRPAYRGLLVMENPATSSPGLAFLMASVAHFGEEGYLDFWAQMRANGLVVVDSWETAYFTHFSGSSGRGPQPMVVSYGSSPPAEVIYAETPLDEAPTASLVGDDMCFRQIEFVGILKGTAHRELAERFVDFMLSQPFQEDMPLNMFVFPVNTQAALPEAFARYAQIPAHPATLPADLIAAQRETWIQAWTDTVIK